MATWNHANSVQYYHVHCLMLLYPSIVVFVRETLSYWLSVTLFLSAYCFTIGTCRDMSLLAMLMKMSQSSERLPY